MSLSRSFAFCLTLGAILGLAHAEEARDQAQIRYQSITRDLSKLGVFNTLNLHAFDDNSEARLTTLYQVMNMSDKPVSFLGMKIDTIPAALNNILEKIEAKNPQNARWLQGSVCTEAEFSAWKNGRLKEIKEKNLPLGFIKKSTLPGGVVEERYTKVSLDEYCQAQKIFDLAQADALKLTNKSEEEKSQLNTLLLELQMARSTLDSIKSDTQLLVELDKTTSPATTTSHKSAQGI